MTVKVKQLKGGDPELWVVDEPWRHEYVDLFVEKGCTGLLLGAPGKPAAMPDIDFVAELPGLVSIRMLRGVSDCSAVSKVSGLVNLQLATDYKGPLPIAGLSRLRQLSMPYLPAVADVAGLTGLTELMVWFWPTGVDFDVLGPKPALTWLRLELKRNASVTAGAFAAMPNLRELRLYGGTVADVSGMERLTDLRVLEFNSTKISEVGFVGAMPALTELTMENSGEIATLAPLRGHPALRTVAIAGKTTVADGDLTPLFTIPTLRGVGMERGAKNYSHSPAEIRAEFPPG